MSMCADEQRALNAGADRRGCIAIVQMTGTRGRKGKRGGLRLTKQGALRSVQKGALISPSGV
jgi:hypothetical protein